MSSCKTFGANVRLGIQRDDAEIFGVLGFVGFFIVTDRHAVVRNNHTLALVISQGPHLAKLWYPVTAGYWSQCLEFAVLSKSRLHKVPGDRSAWDTHFGQTL